VLSLDAERVMAECRGQARARDSVLSGVEDLLRKYPGDWYTNGGVVDTAREVNSENAQFEFISYEMTQLVWANPRWRVTTRRGRAQQMVAEAMQWFMNRWTADSDIKPTLEDFAVDYSFCWAVSHVSPQPLPETYESEDPILFPQLSRISPFDFGMDHRAPSPRQARMLWHRYRIDKDDALERARRDKDLRRDRREGWNAAAIRELQETSNAESWLRTNHTLAHQAMSWRGGVDEPDREQVEIVEVYFPGMRLPNKPGPDQGFNGVIATYGVGSGGDPSGAKVIRPPRPFFGPRWGPYEVIGCYIVPDSPWPLSLLQAAAGPIEQSRRISAAVDAQVANYKRLGITNDPVLAKLVADKPNDSIHVYHGLNPDRGFVEVESGGTTAPNVASEQRVLAKRDRVMGFSENQRGRTTGDTATDVDYANMAAQARQGYRRGRFQDGIRRAGKTVAYYGYHTDEIVFPLGSEAVTALGLEPEEEAWFVGGRFEDGSGTTFDDLGLEIEPMSMERPTEQLLRGHGEFLANLMTLSQGFPMLAQMGADVKGIIDAYGEAYGMPKASRFFPGIESVDLASIQPAEAEPRLVRDVGIHGLLKSFGSKGGTGAPKQAPQPQEFSQAAG
jgi:hypothetical protein